MLANNDTHISCESRGPFLYVSDRSGLELIYPNNRVLHSESERFVMEGISFTLASIFKCNCNKCVECVTSVCIFKCLFFNLSFSAFVSPSTLRNISFSLLCIVSVFLTICLS